MKLPLLRRATRIAAIAAVIVSAGACNKESIVYRDKEVPKLPPAPEAAKGFVGYSDTLTQKTTCGDCHLAQQAKWQGTKHSQAVAALAAIKQDGNAECMACHTVNEKGNAGTDPQVGYTSTKDPRYKDVQCESCHGAGEAHALAPTSANRPLASLIATAGETTTDGCGECHTDSHHPTAEEWQDSGHGSGMAFTEDFANNTTQQPCVGCHIGQGALAKWGVTSNYKEKGSTAATRITCAVCHDPHGETGNPAQLRFALTGTDTSKVLCMKCHNRRFKPDQASTRTVHAAETPTFFGYVGYRSDTWKASGDTIIVGTHSTAPMQCLTCHFDKRSVSATQNVTGHTFNAAPCYNADGTPMAGNDCDISARSFKACTASGCHGSEGAARSAMTTAELRIEELAAQVNALLLLVPTTEFRTGDSYISPAEGAKFNLGAATAAGAAVHNPFLTERMLLDGIKDLKAKYGLTVPSSLNLAPQLAPTRTPTLR